MYAGFLKLLLYLWGRKTSMGIRDSLLMRNGVAFALPQNFFKNK
jgi:hypothetical protein